VPTSNARRSPMTQSRLAATARPSRMDVVGPESNPIRRREVRPSYVAATGRSEQ
jgi:hypothetical protein